MASGFDKGAFGETSSQDSVFYNHALFPDASVLAIPSSQLSHLHVHALPASLTVKQAGAKVLNYVRLVSTTTQECHIQLFKFYEAVQKRSDWKYAKYEK